LTDVEKEDIDRAIALSLSEEDLKGKKVVVGKIYDFAHSSLWRYFDSCVSFDLSSNSKWVTYTSISYG
jgi:hypothetical protein